MIKQNSNSFQLTLKSKSNLLDFRSLMDLFHLSIDRYKDKVAYSCHNKDLSFNDIDRLSRDFAAFLQSKLNILQGERVGLMCPNTLVFPIAMWEIIRIGAVQDVVAKKWLDLTDNKLSEGYGLSETSPVLTLIF